jgi:hypothetical protein
MRHYARLDPPQVDPPGMDAQLAGAEPLSYGGD